MCVDVGWVFQLLLLCDKPPGLVHTCANKANYTMALWFLEGLRLGPGQAQRAGGGPYPIFPALCKLTLHPSTSVSLLVR